MSRASEPQRGPSGAGTAEIEETPVRVAEHLKKRKHISRNTNRKFDQELTAGRSLSPCSRSRSGC